ncbi:hypothetical protein CR513_49893, partial [Mucuna pruriens]
MSARKRYDMAVMAIQSNSPTQEIRSYASLMRTTKAPDSQKRTQTKSNKLEENQLQRSTPCKCDIRMLTPVQMSAPYRMLTPYQMPTPKQIPTLIQNWIHPGTRRLTPLRQDSSTPREFCQCFLLVNIPKVGTSNLQPRGVLRNLVRIRRGTDSLRVGYIPADYEEASDSQSFVNLLDLDLPQQFEDRRPRSAKDLKEVLIDPSRT